MNTESIVYLLRKTTLTREAIGKLTPAQFNEIVKEVCFQESVDEYRNQHSVATLLAAIYNTIPRKRGAKTLKASDFLAGDMPQRTQPDSIDLMAEARGVKLPSKEIKERV